MLSFCVLKGADSDKKCHLVDGLTCAYIFGVLSVRNILIYIKQVVTVFYGLLHAFGTGVAIPVVTTNYLVNLLFETKESFT